MASGFGFSPARIFIVLDFLSFPASASRRERRICIVNQLGGLWRDTWWVWVGFLVVTIILAVTVGKFFYLLIPCLPVPFAYFAFNRYDEDGKEKPDL